MRVFPECACPHAALVSDIDFVFLLFEGLHLAVALGEEHSGVQIESAYSRVISRLKARQIRIVFCLPMEPTLIKRL